MNKFKFIIATFILSSYLFSVEIEKTPNKSNSEEINGWFKYRGVFSGQDNGWEANTGNTIGLNLHYTTKSFYNTKANFGFYFDGETGLYDKDEKRPSGQYLTSDYTSKAILGEAYLQHSDFKNQIFYTVGRKHPNYTLQCESQNPVAKMLFAYVPNLFETYSVKYKGLENTTIGLSFIPKFAFGSRSSTDYSFIGEYTNTAGVVIDVKRDDLKGEYLTIGEALGLEKDEVSGIFMTAILNRSIENSLIQLWNYFVPDVTNITYSQFDYTDKNDFVKLKYSLQLLRQTQIGNNLLEQNLKSTIFGAMISADFDGFGLNFAFNKSSETEFFNFFEMDPAFTSSIYSRNAFRSNVTAYKISTKFNILNNLNLSFAYANYGQSDSMGGNYERSLTSSNNATETDIVLAYKMNKQTKFKISKIYRISEYNDDPENTKDLTMNTIRLGADYKF